jgi:hypothetical protein
VADGMGNVEIVVDAKVSTFDQIQARAAEIRPARVLGSILAFPFWLIGIVIGFVWWLLTLAGAAVAVGFVDGRRRSGDGD